MTMKNDISSDDGSSCTTGSKSEEWVLPLPDTVPTILQEKSACAMIKKLQDSFTANPNFCRTPEGMNMLHMACSDGLLQVLKCFVEEFHIDVSMPMTTSRLNETPLHVACQYNQLPIARYLLEHGGSIEAIQTNGYTPIHIACEKGYFDIVVELTKYLKSFKGQVMEMKQNDDWTGFQLAARNGQAKIVEYLIENNLADATAADSNGKTALHFACCNGYHDIVQLLVKQQQKNPSKDNANSMTEATQYNGWNALHFATRYGHADIVQYLITEGNMDVNSKLNVDNMTSLHLACQYGYVDIVQHLLLCNDVMYDAVTKPERLTPFHLACKHGHKQVLEELFKKNGSIVNTLSADLSTGEHYACKLGHYDIVQWIYPLISDKARKNSSGQTPLHSACIEGHIDIATYLISNMSEADVKAVDNKGNTALHCAIQYNRMALMECFSTLGKIFFKAEENKASYLQYACKYGRLDIAKYLIQQHQMKVDHATNDGWTALHAASRNNQLQIVELLVTVGEADVDTTTVEGWTALHLACRLGHLAVVKYLIQHGRARVDVPALDGMTALHFATANGHIDIVQLLLNEGGANVEAKTKSEGLTPLHIASSRGSLGMVKLLLELGASINTRNSKNEIPLVYAKRILNPPPPPNPHIHSSTYAKLPSNYDTDMTIINDIAALLIPKNQLTSYQLDSTACYDSVT